MVFGLSDLGKLLCTNFKTLFSLLTGEAFSDDLLLQFPQSTTDRSLAAGQVWKYSSSAGRRLKCLMVTAPNGVLVEIMKDNDVIAWFLGESGCLPLKNGIAINDYTIRVTNTNTEAAEWSCRMVLY